MRVVVARTLPAAGLDRLTERFDVDVGGLPLDREWLAQHAPGAHAIVADPTVPVDDELLDRAGEQLAVSRTSPSASTTSTPKRCASAACARRTRPAS